MLISKRAVGALMCLVFLFGVSVTAFALEMTLAGIKLSSPAAVVLKKYGCPTRVTVGVVQTTVSTPGGGTTGPITPGMPGPGGGSAPVVGLAPAPVGGMGPMGAAGGFVPGYGSYDGGGSMLPGLPGLAAPGMPTPGMPWPGGGMPGQGQGQGQTVLTEEQVTWTYDLESGTTLEFIISENGRVIQITVGGSQPFKGSKTSKGVQLGSYYKDIIFKYGYPESQSYAGRFLRASYADKHRVVFTFYGPGPGQVKKLVGITIALKPESEEE